MFVSTILSRYFNKRKKKKVTDNDKKWPLKKWKQNKKIIGFIFLLFMKRWKLKTKCPDLFFIFYRIISWYSRLSRFSKWPLNQHTMAPMFRASDAAWGLESLVCPTLLSVSYRRQWPRVLHLHYFLRSAFSAPPIISKNQNLSLILPLLVCSQLLFWICLIAVVKVWKGFEK